jgi:long-chain fatty acid transport protein
MDGRLMLGAGFSFYRGTIDYRKTILTQTPLPRPHDNVAVDAFLEGDGWGYGANFGILYKLTEKLQIGISGKTPAKIAFEGEVKNTLYTIDNMDLYNIAMSQASSPEEMAQLNFLFDDAPRAWINKAEADLKLPGDAGIGFAYKATDKLILTMDLTYTLWSRLDSIIIEIQEVTSGDGPPGGGDDELVVRTKWEDILRLSLGGSYRVSEPLEMRFGFFYDPSPIPDETFSPLFVDIGDKYSFNIGSALHLDNWELGYNFEYIKFSSLDIAPDPDAGNEFDNYPGQYESAIIANHISITYRF